MGVVIGNMIEPFVNREFHMATINKQSWLAFSRDNRKIFWGGGGACPQTPLEGKALRALLEGLADLGHRGGDSNSPDSPEGRGKSRNVTL